MRPGRGLMVAGAEEQRSWAQHVAQSTEQVYVQYMYKYRPMMAVLPVIHVETWCCTCYMVRLSKISLKVLTPARSNSFSFVSGASSLFSSLTRNLSQRRFRKKRTPPDDPRGSDGIRVCGGIRERRASLPASALLFCLLVPNPFVVFREVAVAWSWSYELSQNISFQLWFWHGFEDGFNSLFLASSILIRASFYSKIITWPALEKDPRHIAKLLGQRCCVASNFAQLDSRGLS